MIGLTRGETQGIMGLDFCYVGFDGENTGIAHGIFFIMDRHGASVSQVDASGRITLREHHLEQIDGPLTLTQGFNQNILAFTAAQWTEFSKQLESDDDGLDPDLDDLRLLFLGNAIDVEIDDRGRLKIPEHLRETARLKPGTSRARVLYIGSRFEIWDEAHYQEYMAGRALELKEAARQRRQERATGEAEARRS